MKNLKIEYLKEALTILQQDKNYLPGICSALYVVISDLTEYYYVRDFFLAQRPTILSKFWWNRNYRSKAVYWWPLNKEGNEQRIKFLQHLIKKLEDAN